MPTNCGIGFDFVGVAVEGPTEWEDDTRITEDGEVRITEDSETRVTEEAL